VSNQSNPHTDKANFWDILLGCVVLSTLVCACLSSGEFPHISVHITRFLIILGVLIQIPLVYSKQNYLAFFPKKVTVPLLFMIGFFCVVGGQILFGTNIFNTVLGSINPLATQANFFQLILYSAFFIFCIQQYGFRKESRDKYVFFLITLLFLLTLWGLAEKFIGQRLWGYDSLSQDSFGSFLNPNHYGGCVALILPLMFYVLLQRYAPPKGKSGAWLNNIFSRVFYLFDSGVIFILFLIILVIAGCFLSDARLATGVILASLILQWIFSRKGITPKYFFISAFVIIVGIILIFNYYGFETILRTFSVPAFAAAVVERAQVFKESLEIFYKCPLFGTGLGTYQYISPYVVSVLAETSVWHHVHNDFIEVLTETGIVGFSLFFSCLGFLIYLNFPRQRISDEGGRNSLKFQALFALSSIALLECADFSLKIPSVALLFTMQLAFLATNGKGAISPNKLGLWTRSAISAIWLIVALFLIQWTVQDFRLYQSIQGSQNEIRGLEQAVQIQPKDGKGWHKLGEKYFEENKSDKALEAFRTAVSLNPTVARYWFALGKAEYGAGFLDSGREALEQAHFFAPHRPGYLLYLIALYLQETNYEKVKAFSEDLKNLNAVPDENELKYWMGEHYAQKFMEWKEWEINEK